MNSIRPAAPRKLSPAVAERLRQVALAEGGTVSHIMRRMQAQHMPLPIEPKIVSRWLHRMGLSYKRYRTSLKKNAIPNSWRASGSRSTR